MGRRAWEWAGTEAGMRIAMALFALLTVLGGFALGAEQDLPAVGEGSLLYRSPVSGCYQPVR